MKQQFNFETNIENRMPDTGKVFFVDRMTSDYAVAHPFDVDAFIEEVYQKFAGTEFEESSEALRRLWTAVLSVTSPRGDASLYPNKNDEHHPALIEAWLKAGEYWRSGLRIGDLLPAIVPGCKITRLDGGEWIALSPKDMMLLDATSEECRVKSEEFATAADEQNDAPEYSEPAKSEPAPEPKQLDLFAQMQMQIDQLRQENQELRNKQCNMTQNARESKTRRAAACSPILAPSPTSRRAVAGEAEFEREGFPMWCKFLGGAFATVIVLLIIFKTGLLIPLGLIGLGASGFLSK